MIIYKFKTDEEGIDNHSRVIVGSEEVTEVRKISFTLEELERKLEQIVNNKDSIEEQILSKTAEIAEVKKQLFKG